MRQPSEHNMGKFFRLRDNRLIQLRVLVAMNHTPPGRYGIYQLLILRMQVDAFRIYDFIRGLHGFHLFVWIPNHILTPIPVL